VSETRTISLAEWRIELRGRADDVRDVKFVCPICGNEASMRDWHEYLTTGALRDEDKSFADRVAQECIGRVMKRTETRRAFPQEGEDPEAPERPCDYAAFGLLNVCKTLVEMPSGKTIGVFEFAEVP
jgi:RNA polymerase subunit RPABC4/transcription elongation factor Spt4